MRRCAGSRRSPTSSPSASRSPARVQVRAWSVYLGQAPGLDARHEDLSGLPPAWMGVGTLDLFHDEDVAYARRLEAQGTACELVVVPGAFHGFDVTVPDAPVSRAFRAGFVGALRHALFVTKA